jgi:hypothetical protein
LRFGTHHRAVFAVLKIIFSVVLSVLGGLVLCAGSDSNSAPVFGFSGIEIFPIDSLISHLVAADLDADGLTDVVVVNNSRSKISLLYNRTGRTNTPILRASGIKRDLNELTPDARFRLDSIASEKRIAALALANLNFDRWPDIAYFGDPHELIVVYNQGTNGWSAPKRWPLEDGLFSANALVTGDLNGDGRTDLVLLAENHFYLLAQRVDGSLAGPQKVPLSTPAALAQIIDLNGDGRNDLLLANWESPTPLRVRLQGTDGHLGPEIYFKLPAIRALCVDHLDTSVSAQLVTIAQNSGRVTIARFCQQPGETLSPGLSAGQFSVIPLPRTAKANRGLLWADLDRDGTLEMIVAEPESGQISIHPQKPDGNWGPPKTFPSLSGISCLEAADWDSDGRPELFLLSPDERHVGVLRLDANGRLLFPTLIQTEGKPIAIAVGPLQANAPAALAIVVDNDGKRSLVIRTADGRSHTQPLDERFKSTPSAMAIQDLDQDGLPDLVILSPFERVKVLRQKPGGLFEELDVPVPGGALEDPWLSSGDVDGDGRAELLLPQKNFVRAVILKSGDVVATNGSRTNWSFQVREQINGAYSDSLISGATFSSGGTQTSRLFLLDAARRALTVCERSFTGVWEVARNFPLPVSEFDGVQMLPARGTNPPVLAFSGVNAVGLLALGGSVWAWEEMDSYETPIKQGQLRDVIAGDLNGDGCKDIVFLETARGYVDLVQFTQQHKLVPGNRWPVFEERTFRNRRTDMPEPREALIMDVTGDGKNDLLLLVHDRVLLYTQE